MQVCYPYTGIDEQILNHSISPPQPNKTERGHLATRVSFSLRNVEKWDIIGVGFLGCEEVVKCLSI